MKLATKLRLPLKLEYILIAFMLALANMMGCTESQKESIPARPRFVSKSTDTAYYDTGIRPIYGNLGIYLEWHPNKEEDLAGYNLYRTTQTTFIDGQEVPVNFSLLKKIPLGSQKPQGLADTVYEDLAIDLNQPYYYRLSAYSRSGGESVTSDEDPHYELRSLSDGLEVKSGGQTATVLPFPQDSILTFTWTPRGSATGGKYLIKIYEFDDNTGEEIIIAWAEIKAGYVSGEPLSLSIKFSNPGSPISPDIANGGRILNHIKSGDQTYGRLYYWRVYYTEGGTTDYMTLQGSIAEGTFNLGD